MIATSRLRLILSQLTLRMPLAPGPTYPHPRLRSFVIDVLAEGRRKQIAHVLLEADIGGVKEKLAELRLRGGEPVSMTSYIAKGFALAVEENKRMQAYRLGRSRIVVFDDVDPAFMIEREWEGEALPVFYLLREAQRKTVYEIQRELQAARETPLGALGPMSALEMRFFLLPAFLRKALWFFVRRNPYWFKDLAGTAGVTSMGMYTSGAVAIVPITPMTLTLSIGTIDRKLALQDGDVIERDVIHMTFSFDHDIIDGAPGMRFAERFKKILLARTALSLAGATREDRDSALEA